MTDAARSTTRSLFFNRPLLLAKGAGNTRAGRRFRDVMRALLDDLPPDTPESTILLARRAAVLTLSIEEEEARLARGERVDLPSLNSSIGTLRRLLDTLALHRATSAPVDLAGLMGGLPEGDE
jgi:hypothetical protein